MAKTFRDIRSLAREHTELCVKVLQSIAAQPSAPHASRVAAAKELLDRGWGKAVQVSDATVTHVSAERMSDAQLLAIVAERQVLQLDHPKPVLELKTALPN